MVVIGDRRTRGKRSSSSQLGWRPLAAWAFPGRFLILTLKRGKSTCLKRARDFRVRLPPPFLTLGGSLYPQPTLPPGQVEVVAQRISISCGLGHCAVGLRRLAHASRTQCDHRGGVLGRSTARERLAPLSQVFPMQFFPSDNLSVLAGLSTPCAARARHPV